MSSDTVEKKEGLDFERFLEFMFVLLARAKADHDNPKEFAYSIKMTIMTIIVVLLAGASELNVIAD